VRRGVALGAAASIAVVVLLAVPVFAFSSTSSRSKDVEGLHAASVSARCAGNTHVQFGGYQYQLSYPLDLQRPTVVATGMRITASNQLTVDGQGFSPSGKTSRLTATAYCYPGPAPSKATNTAVIRHQAGGVTATCPAGKVVVAAGFASQAGTGHGHDVNSIERIAANKLRVTLVAAQQVTASLTAIAYCRSGPAPTLVSKSVAIAPGHLATARAKCPSGSSLAFGGVIAEAHIGNEKRPVIYPVRISADNTTVWRVSGRNAGLAGGKLTALAYCR